MSDQAQGLRALADQARRDQHTQSLSQTYPVENTTGLSTTNQPDTGQRVSPASLPVVETDIALTDGRFHTQAINKRVSNLSQEGTGLHRARVVAVTSGKGGVGKTNFSTNMSLMLAQSGQRVIVLDADLGLANLHVVLGVEPRYNLEHVMRGEMTLRDVLYPAPGGIHIVGGGSGITELANLDEDTRQDFVSGLRELDNLADVIVIDTGAGLSRNVMAFLCAVEEIIVVTTPEPTAITDAYATIKVVTQENPSARIMLVVNMAQSATEGDRVADKLIRIARQFLHVELDYLGYVPQDAAVSRAVRSQQPFTIHQPHSPAARSVVAIASQLGYRTVTPTPANGFGGFLNKMQNFFGFRDTAHSSRR